MSDNELVSLLRLIENGFNSSRFDELDPILAPDLVAHAPFSVGPGREGFKGALAAVREAFPDAHVSIDGLGSSGHLVFRLWTLEGTHRGRFAGIEPTNRRIKISGVDVERFRGEVIVEHWSF